MLIHICVKVDLKTYLVNHICVCYTDVTENDVQWMADK